MWLRSHAEVVDKVTGFGPKTGREARRWARGSSPDTASGLFEIAAQFYASRHPDHRALSGPRRCTRSRSSRPAVRLLGHAHAQPMRSGVRKLVKALRPAKR